MDTANQAGAFVVWLGLPITKDGGQSRRWRVINRAVQAEVERRPGKAAYVDMYGLLSDDGAYAPYLRAKDGLLVKVRADDGVHLERAGGDIVAGRSCASCAACTTSGAGGANRLRARNGEARSHRAGARPRRVARGGGLRRRRRRRRSRRPPLEGTEWTLVSGVDAPDDAVPTLTLEEGNASGFGGCNNFMGGYELDGDSISIGPLAGTLMACEEPKMAAETAYLPALEAADSWAVEDGELVLSSGGEETLRFSTG